ncbi:SDR family NAD(P)-dependent oxidoreductase [Amycolatopsis jejuensis]|uniref:SDR family NAD(P)-dependent oxidoreductase n=1 Tax=Amycolatopsis jejuensis TaxID=330084 RepID=UPI00138E4A16|nr:SDR family NAD(P)-dependent oxidoreductase [Amycolatopsis jejuensis]
MRTLTELACARDDRAADGHLASVPRGEVRLARAAFPHRFGKGPRVVAYLGRPNAGVSTDDSPVDEYDEAAFDTVMSVNMKSVWYGVRAAVPYLRKRGGGIVITSSTHGISGRDRHGADASPVSHGEPGRPPGGHGGMGVLRPDEALGSTGRERMASATPSTIFGTVSSYHRAQGCRVILGRRR